MIPFTHTHTRTQCDRFHCWHRYRRTFAHQNAIKCDAYSIFSKINFNYVILIGSALTAHLSRKSLNDDDVLTGPQRRNISDVEIHFRQIMNHVFHLLLISSIIYRLAIISNSYLSHVFDVSWVECGWLVSWRRSPLDDGVGCCCWWPFSMNFVFFSFHAFLHFRTSIFLRVLVLSWWLLKASVRCAAFKIPLNSFVAVNILAIMNNYTCWLWVAGVNGDMTYFIRLQSAFYEVKAPRRNLKIIWLVPKKRSTGKTHGKNKRENSHKFQSVCLVLLPFWINIIKIT